MTLMPEDSAAFRSTLDLRNGRTTTHACAARLLDADCPGFATFFAPIPETDVELDEVDLSNDELAVKRVLRRVA